MRLHTLEVTAFGPFAATETVDFDALASAGLFLLHGPTGAGKTSVLDAVVFALFGSVPGARQKGNRLRSDHAAAGVATSVRLELTVRDRRLRVERSPAWQRPKLRGEGTTTEPAKVLVSESRDGEWQVLTTRNDEAGHLLRGLLGMSGDQFCQVVLLPQGQFAEFLRADAEARRPLLEQLFGTERFSAVEQWLVERRNSTRRVLDRARAEVASVVERVAEAAGADLDGDDLPAVEQPERLPAWVEALRSAAATSLERATLDAQAARERLARARADEERARSLVERSGRRSELEAELARTQEALTAAEPLRAQLAAAARALPVDPLLAAVAETRAEVEAREDAVDVAERELSWLDSTLPASLGEPRAGSCRALARARHDEIAVLADLAGEEAERETLAGQLADLEQALAATDVRLAELDHQLSELPERLAEVRARREGAATAAAQLPGARAGCEAAARAHAAGLERDRLAPLASAATTAATEAVDAVQQAREDWLDLRQRRLDGIAAELAGGLHAGQSCPVCGSLEHPAPARAADDSISKVDEQRAEALFQRAEAERTRLQGERERLALALAAAAAGSGEEPTKALAARATALAERRDELAARADLLDELTQQENELDQAMERVRRERGTVAERRAADATAADRVDKRIAELDARLRGARGEDPSISFRRLRLEREAGALQKLAEELDAAARARRRAEHAVQTAESAALTAGFGRLEDAAAAVRPVEWRDQVGSRLAELDSQLHGLRARLSDPQLAEVEVEPGALEAANAALAEAERTHRAAVGAEQAAAARARRLGELADQLASAIAAWRPVRDEHELVAGLSKLAEGTATDNALRMRLSAYVLAARLEQVAAAATERLLRMSSGRYTLTHSDDLSGGRARSGLGLRVGDAWTGAERDPSTLSGGESFFASLALALGLADVVTAEAGGSPIEMLFVDEGFGSLDDDSLEEVMAVLDGLRDGGRAVGVVSHVGDLRQRIPAQLEVRKGRAGSHLVPVATSG